MGSQTRQKEGDNDHNEKADNVVEAKLDKLISLAEVAAHSTSDDFWTVVDDVVYDMSGFVHPGGSIVLLAAGTDSTVMFHQYHLSEQVARQCLRNRRVGVLNGKSPKMGPVYAELKLRVAQALKHEPKRPRAATVLFVVDQLCVCALLAFSLFTSEATPCWQLALVALLAPSLILRLFGQSHALGHMHICHHSKVHTWGMSLLASGAPGIAMFCVPESDKNPRELLNECRELSQGEFPQKRGPGEHQSVHHVKGAELEHDECYQVASMFQGLRLSENQTHMPQHRFQPYLLFQFLAAVFADLSLVTAVSITERVCALWSYFIPQRLVGNALASLVGIAVSLVIARTQLLLPWYYGFQGLFLYLAVCLFKYLLFNPGMQLMYGQHKWDYEVDATEVDQDWVTHNAESSLSVSGIEWHPICWGNGGASPSSLTYHLEHTLLPGVNYLHHPKIAPIVQATLAEFGVTCNVLVGKEALQEHYQTTMNKYARRKNE